MSGLVIDVPYGIGYIRFENLTELQFKVLQSLLDNQKLPERRSAQMPFATPNNEQVVQIVTVGGRASGKMAAIAAAMKTMEHRSVVSVWPQDDIDKANLNMPRPPIAQQTTTPLDRVSNANRTIGNK
jgi:hypothetical protein